MKINGVLMKKMIEISLFTFTLLFVTGCSPKVGSDDWCTDMKEKEKGEWTVTQAGDFAKHCLLK